MRHAVRCRFVWAGHSRRKVEMFNNLIDKLLTDGAALRQIIGSKVLSFPNGARLAKRLSNSVGLGGAEVLMSWPANAAAYGRRPILQIPARHHLWP